MSKKAAPPIPAIGKKGGKGTPPPFIKGKKGGNDGDADDKKSIVTKKKVVKK